MNKRTHPNSAKLNLPLQGGGFPQNAKHFVGAGGELNIFLSFVKNVILYSNPLRRRGDFAKQSLGGLIPN